MTSDQRPESMLRKVDFDNGPEDWSTRPGRYVMGADYSRAVIDEVPEFLGESGSMPTAEFERHFANETIEFQAAKAAFDPFQVARERTAEEELAVVERAYEKLAETYERMCVAPEPEDKLAEFGDAAWEVADELITLLVKKQADYGSGNILHPPIDPKLALLVRMSDKLARLTNLLNSGGEPRNEPLRDSFIDLAGYAIIGLMLVDGTFPE